MAASKRGTRKAKTKTAGAVKGGRGKYQFTLAKVKDVPAGTGYSTSHGGVVEGQRMLVGYIHKARGTGSRMHTHKNEQFNYVVRGTLVGSVNGRKVVAPAGTLIYIPANAPHTLIADPKSTQGLYPKVFIASGKNVPAKTPDGKVVHVPYTDLLKADGKPKAAKDIWNILVKAGVPRYAELVSFSDDPGEAAANYYILKLMGYPDVKVLVM